MFLFISCYLLELRGKRKLAKTVRMEWFDTGVEYLSLSSSPPSSEEGHITACPHTTVTLTCTATQVGSMTWRDQGLIHTFLPGDIESEQTRVVHDDPYTLTLTTVENVMGALADFTSTLEVMVDDIDNGTDITCAVFQNQDHLLIYIASRLRLCIVVNGHHCKANTEGTKFFSLLHRFSISTV